jgi:membrane-associated phospholipid phosphatase
MPGPVHYLSATLTQLAAAFGPPFVPPTGHSYPYETWTDTAAPAGEARVERTPPVSGFWDRPPSRLGCAAIWLVQTGVLSAIYLRVNAATSGHAVATPLLPLESRIPLVAAAFPVYISLYFELTLPIVLLRTWRTFVRMQTACLLACLVACLVYVLFPMSYPRPQLAAHSAVQGWLVHHWEVDGPACTFPSLHVTLAWLLAFSLGARSRNWRAAWSLNALIISVSTLLVKQHYIVDVAGGIALAVVSWRVAPRLNAWCGRLATAEPHPSWPRTISPCSSALRRSLSFALASGKRLPSRAASFASTSSETVSPS